MAMLLAAEATGLGALLFGQFDHVDVARGDCLVTFGWVMAEELLKHG
jgi:hypothetical protein